MFTPINLLSALSVIHPFMSQFGAGLTPPSSGVFSPPKADNDTILVYFNNTLSFLITLLTFLGGLFFLFQFFTGALNWISAGGEEKKVQESRDRITQGVMGLVIVVIAYAVVGLISTVLGIPILNPGDFLQKTFT